jgi:hypothetical protein
VFGVYILRPRAEVAQDHGGLAPIDKVNERKAKTPVRRARPHGFLEAARR